MPLRSTRWQDWVLPAIMCVALYLRLASIRFGLPALNDPDEMMFEMGALRMLRGPTLDPGWFGHPATTTMYVLALTNAATFVVAYLFGLTSSVRQFVDLVYADPSWLILPGRVVMTLFGLATIIVASRLARRFFGAGTGLATAVLLAVNPVHVTYSQIIRSDMMACLFMLLCLSAAVSIAERGCWRGYLRAAAWLGVAIATKWPFALAGLAICSATLMAVRAGVLDRRQALLRLTVAGVMAIVVLALVSPYLLIDYPTVLRNIQGEGQARHLGATGGSVWQNLGWYTAGPIQAGFGLPGLAFLLVGAVRLPRQRVALAILAPVTIAFVALLCVQQLVWERWALPLMPLGAIVAAWGIITVAGLLQRRLPARFAPWAITAMLLVTLLPLGVRLLSDYRMRLDDTRQRASAWARGHIPRGSVVLVEHFAFDLLAEPWHFLFPMGDAGCVDVMAYLHGKVSYATIEHARGNRSIVDYGTIAPAMRTTCRADFAILTQYDRYRQESVRFPREYAAYRSLNAQGHVVAIFSPHPNRIGGPVVTILDLRH